MRYLFLLLIAPIAWAGVEITRPLMELTKDGELISRHTSEVEAMERASSEAGTYRLVRPTATIIVSGAPPEPNEPPPPDPSEPTTDPVSGGIVYTRVPRTTGTHEVTLKDGTPYDLTNADIWDRLPEVGRQFTGFNAPGQLVIRDDSGVESIVFDCFVEDRPCVPFDASVSLDGTKIAFAVYSAEGLVSGWWNGVTLPNQYLNNVLGDSRIYIYEIATQITTAWTHTQGIYDNSPVWLPDGRIMFTSTRDGQYRPWLNKITPKNRPEPRLFTALPDGSDVIDISPHEVASAMHPYLLDNGRVLYGSLWYSHNLAYIGTNGSINWPTTLDNMWAVSDIDYQGGDMTAILGGHRNSFKDATGRTKTLKALHFIGQRTNGDWCTANYYRSNNLGLGDVPCAPLETRGIEGPAPSFMPSGIYSVANWSKSNDEPSRKIDGIYQGKVGWPEGTDDNQLILTVGQGHCTSVASGIKTGESIGDQNGCSVGLYKTSVIPSVVMGDLELIVDDPQWHEFNARVIRSRDIATTELMVSGDDSCVLASSDAGSTDAHPKKPYSFNSNYFNTANNGGEIDGLDHAELSAIRFYEVIPNPLASPDFKNAIGNKIRLLGDVPLLADKSFTAQLPCDTPYLMAGVDSKGRIIKRDQIPQSLRPGEKRVCSGCHLHGEEGRAYEDSLAYISDPFPLLTSIPVPTFEQDIKPLLLSRCGSCHIDDVPIGDYAKLTWDYFQDFVPADRKLQVSTSTNERKKYGLQRPQISKYVNSMFARESLLYWKAANQRTDGRTDATYDNDIDFGADHPTTMTAAELSQVAGWIDSGAGL